MKDLRELTNEELSQQALRCISNLSLWSAWGKPEGQELQTFLARIQQEQIKRMQRASDACKEKV